MKQKTEDYKISAVNYYLKNNDNQALKPSCYKQTLQGYEKTQP